MIKIRRRILLNLYKNLHQTKGGEIVLLEDVLDYIGNLNNQYFLRYIDKYDGQRNYQHIDDDTIIIENEHGDLEEFRYKDAGWKFPEDDYDNKKKKETPVTVFGAFSRIGIREEDKSSLTNLLYMDIDIRQEHQASDMKNVLLHHIQDRLIDEYPFVHACWVSLSGTGLGFLIKCDAIRNKEHFEVVYDQLMELFNTQLLAIYGLCTDPNAKGMTQPTVLPCDPNIRINNESELFPASTIDFNVKKKPNGNADKDNSEPIDNSLPSRKAIIEKLVRNRNTYYPLYRRYTENPYDCKFRL
ncbi:MAG: hypothetical protein OEW75_06995 [Cyclobacteriaceae bacterium]|nr:hypothetical protein [Cyclobacteriaceae bacterium]